MIKTLKKIIGERKITVFASTREGEEKQIFESYINSADNIDSLLIVIPRHPERFNEVFKLAKASGFKVERRSSVLQCSEDTDILIGDNILKKHSNLMKSLFKIYGVFVMKICTTKQ